MSALNNLRKLKLLSVFVTHRTSGKKPPHQIINFGERRALRITFPFV